MSYLTTCSSKIKLMVDLAEVLTLGPGATTAVELERVVIVITAYVVVVTNWTDNREQRPHDEADKGAGEMRARFHIVNYCSKSGKTARNRCRAQKTIDVVIVR
jgi:hypothetical protein